jgi:hypothetical protein
MQREENIEANENHQVETTITSTQQQCAGMSEIFKAYSSLACIPRPDSPWTPLHQRKEKRNKE